MEQLKNALNAVGVEITEEQLKKFSIYMDRVLEYNEHINLTAITDRDEFIKKHFIDSLLGTFCDEVKNSKLIADVGTGAGFPGVPMAIMNPDKRFVLMDSLNKRLKIVSELCERAGIDNVEVLHSRAEDVGRNKDYRETFDLVISRAVANLSVLAELCIPLVRKNGYLLAYKGPKVDEELKEAEKAIRILGGVVRDVRETSFEDLSHNIIFIQKGMNTPKAYPRKAGTPSKNPIR